MDGTSPLPDTVTPNLDNSTTLVWNNVTTLAPGVSTELYLVAHINGDEFGTLENNVNVTGVPPTGDNVTDNDTEEVYATLPFSISGYKFDAVTPHVPLAGWNITVSNSTTSEVVGNDTTNESGYWQVTGLGNGTYNVSEELKLNWTAINPASGWQNVTINGADVREVNFYNDPRNLSITKVANKKTVKRGEEITYTITICNNGNQAAKDVVVEDIFDGQVEFISASPMPDSDGFWRFDEIPADECVEIILTIRIPKQDLDFAMDQGVSGEGFVNVANDYSTTFEPYILKNRVIAIVTFEGSVRRQYSDSESVNVLGEPGTELETREHGSGVYESEEQVRMSTENKSIEMNKDMSAEYKPTTLGLYRNRTITYSSTWTEEARAKNRVTGATMTESYRYATSIDRESRMKLDINESEMDVNSEFDGKGHIGFLKKSSPGASANVPSTFEVREDYVGSFKVLEKIGEYGSSVTSEKSTEGQGFVAVDKEIGATQDTYEYGTGTYESDEVINTASNYMAKDISVVHVPTSQSLTDDVSLDQDLKWKEGMSSKNPKKSFIGEEYTSIESLDKETVALGLNEMSTETVFSGEARYRAVLTEGVGNDPIEMDEKYTGDYSIERNILFRGVPKYDQPHLNVTKTLESVNHIRDPVHKTKETVLAGEDVDNMIYVATYNITVENDGNKDLKPVYVIDYFPPNTSFIEPASMKPSSLSFDSANWTLTHLSIGDPMTITLRLDVTKYFDQNSAGIVGDEMVNRVKVCGGYGEDDWVCAANYSALEIDWLTCCLDDETLSVSKTAQIDENESELIRYAIEIKNEANATRVATVTDNLPEGMTLLESSPIFDSYENDVVTWNLAEIEPFETVTIEYKVEVLRNGKFVNTVEVDARSVDGSAIRPVHATSVMNVDEIESPTPYPGWQPPDWDFQYAEYNPGINCDDMCETTP